MSTPYYDCRCPKTFELFYECDCCKQDPLTCKHENLFGRWAYVNSTIDPVKTSGFCYDCGGSFIYSVELNKLVIKESV